MMLPMHFWIQYSFSQKFQLTIKIRKNRDVLSDKHTTIPRISHPIILRNNFEKKKIDIANHASLYIDSTSNSK